MIDSYRLRRRPGRTLGLLLSVSAGLSITATSLSATAANTETANPEDTLRLAQADSSGPPTAADADANANDARKKPPVALEEIVVTGSRIVRSDVNTANPVTMIDSTTIESLGLTSVGDVVAQLPQNSNFTSSTNVGAGNFNVGAQLANLRGLNPFFGTRTLTLVNTQRFVPTTAGGAVDLTVIPSLLIARTEVVTGGASAVYGSDAVAGVINVILDNKLQGVKFQIDDGQTTAHDGNGFHVGLAGGTGFADSKGHVVVGAEFASDKEIGDCSLVRSWCAQQYGEFTNTLNASNGQPHYIIGPGSHPLNSYTGILTSAFGARLGQFDASGTSLVPFNLGNYAAGAGGFSPMQGGDGPGSYDSLIIRPPVKHYSIYGNTTYQLTDTLEAGIDASFARREASNTQASNGALGFPLDVVFPDNAYLSAAAAAALGGAPGYLTSDTANLIPQINDTVNTNGRVVFSLKGHLAGDWNWDGYFEYGENKTHETLKNDVVNDLGYPFTALVGGPPEPANSYDFFSWALDAVKDPSTGNIVCRATLAGPAYNPLAAGCQPLNLFGAKNASAAGLAYAYRDLHEDSLFRQEVFSANVHGTLFAGWGAGSIAGAAGVEYRHDAANVTHDQQDQPWYNNYLLSYGSDYAGHINVTEGFVEVNAPLLKDLPGVKYLELDASVRETSNKNENEASGIGNTANFASWKLGMLYDASNWLRFRGTRSRDVRAPSFYELYSQNRASGGFFGTFVNPWTGNPQDAVNIVTGGNVNLKPELADTTTAGVVLNFSGALSGLRLSADWYQIKLNEAISQLGGQGIIGSCFATGTYCNLLQGVSNGAGGFTDVTAIQNYNLNLTSYITKGIDYEADYLLPLSRFSERRMDTLDLRIIASYLYDMLVNTGAPGAPVINYAGQSGPTAAFGNFNTSPKWQANAIVTYFNGPITAVVQARYIGSGRFETIDPTTGLAVLGPGDPGYSTTYAASINNNKVASATYVNLALTYRLPWMKQDGESLELFGTLDNVFDRDPAVAPGGNGYPTNPVYFDTIGRRWDLGLRLKFR